MRRQPALGVFAVGCAAVALGFAFAYVWCFIVLPVIALGELVLRLSAPDGGAR